MARRTHRIFADGGRTKSKFPWWAGLSLALVSFLILNWVTEKTPMEGSGADWISHYFSPGLLHAFACYGQFVIPAIILLISLASAISNSKRAKLYDKTARNPSSESLKKMSWKKFEFLVAEYFRRLGFGVEENASGSEGVPLIASKGREKYLVQCRQWKLSKVDVDAVQELRASVSDADATGGIVVTSGEFTNEAKVFARANKIILLDGDELCTNLNAHKLFELQSVEKSGGWLRKMLWILAAFLVLTAGASLFYSYKTGIPIASVWKRGVERFIPGHRQTPGGQNVKSGKPVETSEPKESRFTDIQIKKAKQELLHQKEQEQFNRMEKGNKGSEKKYYYEIELVSGGNIFTDNITTSGDKITYRDKRGLVVSLNRNEVKTMKKIEVDK